MHFRLKSGKEVFKETILIKSKICHLLGLVDVDLGNDVEREQVTYKLLDSYNEAIFD